MKFPRITAVIRRNLFKQITRKGSLLSIWGAEQIERRGRHLPLGAIFVVIAVLTFSTPLGLNETEARDWLSILQLLAGFNGAGALISQHLPSLMSDITKRLSHISERADELRSLNAEIRGNANRHKAIAARLRKDIPKTSATSRRLFGEGIRNAIRVLNALKRNRSLFDRLKKLTDSAEADQGVVEKWLRQVVPTQLTILAMCSIMLMLVVTMYPTKHLPNFMWLSASTAFSWVFLEMLGLFTMFYFRIRKIDSLADEIELSTAKTKTDSEAIAGSFRSVEARLASRRKKLAARAGARTV